jgi:hypothetical protein
MAKIAELIINFKANIVAFASDIRKISDISFSSAKNIAKSFEVMAGVAVAAFAAIKTATYAMAVETAGYGDELAKASQKTGISVSDLSALRLAADQSNISFESLVKGLGIFSKNLAGLQSTTSKSAVAMRALFGDDYQSKIRDASGNLKPLYELLLMVSDRFRTTKDGVEKAAIAIAAFSKGGLQYIPLLNSNVRELEAEFKRLGLTWSLEDALAAQTLHEQMKLLAAQLQGVEFQIGKALIPTLIAVCSWFENASLKVEEYSLRLATVVKIGDALAAGGALQPVLALKFWADAISLADRATAVEEKFQAAVSRTAGTIAARTRAAAALMGGGVGDVLAIPQAHKIPKTPKIPQVEEVKDEIAALIAELDKANQTFGFSADALKLYELAQDRVDASTISLIARQMASNEAQRRGREETLRLSAAADAYQESIVSLAAQIEAESLTSTQAFEMQIEKLQELVDAGYLTQDAFDFKRLKLEGEELDKQLDSMTNSARKWGETMSSAFTELILHGSDFRQTLQNMIALIGEMILKTYVFKSIAEAFEGSSGFWGSFGSFFSGLAGKAGGGDVGAGTPYMVGERGPELFVPDVSGAIIPHGKAAGGQVVYNIDARGSEVGVERRIVRALKAVHGSAIANAQLAMQDRMLRSGV